MYEGYVGSFNEKEGVKVLGQIPNESARSKGYYEDGYFYFTGDYLGYYGSPVTPSNRLTRIEKNTWESESFNFENSIVGCIEGEGDNLYIVEYDGSSFFLYDSPEDKSVYSFAGEDVTGFILWGCIDKNSKVSMFYNGSFNTFSGAEQEKDYFSALGIMAESFYGAVKNNDEFKVYTAYEDSYYVYTVNKLSDKKIDKKTIRFCMSYRDPVLEDFISEYNNKNPYYSVIIETAPQNMDIEDYKKNISVEISTGTGPELITGNLIAPLRPVRNGTFAVLDEIIASADNSDFIPGALACGIVDGHQYGIPYHISPINCVTGNALVGDIDSWTLDECIDIIDASEYTLFGSSHGRLVSIEDIVFFLGLYDESNKDLIDWENGQSNLEDESFIKLLEFAKKYGSPEEKALDWYNKQEDFEKLYKIACDCEWRSPSVNIGIIQNYSNKYNGDDNWIGFPRSDKSSAYINSICIYLNDASEQKNGALDFLSYLISVEGQKKLAKCGLKNKDYGFLSLRMSVLDMYIDEYNEEMKYTEGGATGPFGYYEYKELTDEECEKYKRMLAEAKPVMPELEQILVIVDEELGAFIAGQKTAEETARIIDSRVQLYLDENR